MLINFFFFLGFWQVFFHKNWNSSKGLQKWSDIEYGTDSEVSDYQEEAKQSFEENLDRAIQFAKTTNMRNFQIQAEKFLFSFFKNGEEQ